MALNFVRTVVSQDLKRIQDDTWDLNLTYILSNVIAMSYPGTGVEGMYRNNIYQVAAYLDQKHPDHYMVFNLSERNYNVDIFHGRVVDFGWPDHHGPPLQTLIDAVADVDRWIRADPRNVAIVHCLAGRGRTGTLICSYLCFAGYFSTMQKALQYYANVRSNKNKGVTQPSQLRYCKYIDLILNKSFVPKPKCISIQRITLTPIPNFPTQSGIRPILNIYRYAPGVQQLIWTSMKNPSNAPVFYPKDGELTFDTSDMPPLAGDIMIKLSHVTSWMWVSSKTEIIMRLILNTSFCADGQSVLSLARRDLDIVHKDPRFPANTQVFMYTSVIPDGPQPPKQDWDPEKFDDWVSKATEYRKRLLTHGDATSSSPQPLLPIEQPKTVPQAEEEVVETKTTDHQEESQQMENDLKELLSTSDQPEATDSVEQSVSQVNHEEENEEIEKDMKELILSRSDELENDISKEQVEEEQSQS